MPNVAASVPYSPYEGQTPSEGGGGQASAVKANPGDFGGQVGEAVDQAGQKGQEIAQQYQGMVNETLAHNAELEYQKQQSVLEGKYKSLEGLAASDALPDYINQSSTLRQQYRSALPMAAAQSFDMNTTRQFGYALNEANLYAATQIKQANKTSNQALLGSNIDQAGDLSVASDDTRFGEKIGNIKHFVAVGIQDAGWGSGTGMTQNPSTGELSFDNSERGQQANGVYESYKNEQLGKAYQNRFESLADQDVHAAYVKYAESRDQIPGDTQVRLDAFFAPKLKEAGSSNISNGVLSSAAQDYHASVSSPAAVNNLSANIFNAIHQNESSGQQNAPTSPDGAVGPSQILPSTFKEFAKPGEDINNPKDNLAVGQRIVDSYTQKYNGDPARVAVAYFSGPGNVSPAGSPTPWIKDSKDGLGENVSSYVAKMSGNLQKSSGTSYVPTQADFFTANRDSLINQARQQAQTEKPGDSQYELQAVSKVEQSMNSVIRKQQVSRAQDEDTLTKALNGDMSNGNRPTSLQQLTALSPDVKSAWDKMQQYNHTGTALIQSHLLTDNSRGYTPLETQMNKQLTTMGLSPIRFDYSAKEADSFINNFNSQTPENQRNLLYAFSNTYGPNTQTAAKSFEKSSPNFSTAASLVAAGRNDPNSPNVITAMKILEGDNRIRENPKEAIPAAKVDTALSKYSSILPSDVYDQVRSASRSVYMADNNSANGGDVNKSIREVIGSDPASVNGSKVFSPLNVDAHVFENAVSKPSQQQFNQWISDAYKFKTGQDIPPNFTQPQVQGGKQFDPQEDKVRLKWVKQNTYQLIGADAKPILMQDPGSPTRSIPTLLRITDQNLGTKYANQ